ncbi:MAG: 50S ribosomal protein L10 [Firmicutes bacterium]|nr:50S ribosomal protein L10 [Bacillota bacterium]
MANEKALEEKKQAVSEIKDSISRSKSAILTNYRGLNVAQVTKLRRGLREAGIEYKVAKNTLIRLAAREAGIEGLDKFLEGPTAIAFGYADPALPAKLLADFARENWQLEVKAGILEGRIIQADQVRWLADLPSREVLLARVAGAMQAPMAGFAGVLQGTIRSFVYAVDALRKQREAGEATT